MKTTAVLVALVLSGNTLLMAQTQAGHWELSLSGNFGSVSGSTETHWSSPSSTYESEQEAQGYLSLALRPGYYIVDGLEIEPEILWTAIQKYQPVFNFTGNVAYTFSIPESRVSPFVLAGYGLGNGIPTFQRLLSRSSDKLDVGVLNLGAGLKIFVATSVALRLEYRYQRYSQERSGGSPSNSYTVTTVENFHHGFVGFSVFLP